MTDHPISSAKPTDEKATGRFPRIMDQAEEAAAPDRLQDEIARLRGEVAQLRALAYRDALTGLRNRRFLDERLREELSRGERDPSYLFSIVVFDLDNFKQINDSFGHDRGDQVLRWIGRALERTLRRHDVCCRAGGDEFVIVLPGSSKRIRQQVVGRLRRQLVAASRAELDVPVRLSIGEATWPDDARTLPDLLVTADAAMYREKKRHRTGDYDAVSEEHQPAANAIAGEEVSQRLRVCFDGVDAPVRVRATLSANSVRMSTRLPFLRVGSPVRLAPTDEQLFHWARVRRVRLTEGEIPELEVELELPGKLC
jgi:diguanylate cyclase (GGDEF)-like protein